MQRRLDRAAPAPRPMRRPDRLRRDHPRIVDDERVAGPQQIRQIAHRRDPPARAPGRTTSSRAASRGRAGRSAMRSGGRSKSNRSVRMRLSRRLASACRRHTPQCDQSARPPHADRRLDDLVRVLHRLAALDLVDVLHAFDHLAPDGVLLVEEARVVEADEELAVGAVRALRARHRGGAAHMRLGVELGRQVRIARAAGAGAVRAAGLRHEAVDHAMEHDAVVEAFAHQLS